MSLLSLLQAHQAHQAHQAQQAHQAHQNSGGGIDSYQLALAVALARDGIVGGGALDTVEGPPRKQTQFQRLENLDPRFAIAILAGELMEDFRVTGSQTDPAEQVQVTVRSVDGDPQVLFQLQAPSDALLRDQLALIAGYADLRLERLPEIIAQAQDIVPFFAPLLPFLGAPQTRRVVSLLAVTDAVTSSIVQRVKLLIGCRRPLLFSDRLQPLIDTPTHGSYPSGHATQAFSMATILAALNRSQPGGEVVPAADNQLFRMAARIAANRTVAGVHYPIDSAAGALLGITVANTLLQRMGALSGVDEHSMVRAIGFDAGMWPDAASGDDGDFYLDKLVNAMTGHRALTSYERVSVLPAPIAGQLWRAAIEDWGRRWG
ncbi:phosphatase PAP2 family protein [Paracoccus sp. M683]|uniref:phosphatase PAP2 family protein n=1 Tax=Paracoccus sp. M683 TaxID=2594268 RepID=UPI00163D89BD|nr:phosphatase PAP2 family protein [Paracoccus sp. M683]